MKFKVLSVTLLLLTSLTLSAQQEKKIVKGGELGRIDTLALAQKEPPAEEIQLKKPRKFYDPKVASKRSAIIPGWGQIYNDSWWKVPILYGGFALSFYYIDFNNEQRLLYEGLAKELIADQAAGVAINENELRVYRRRADTWRKNRDLLYLVTIGVYVLNIAEAAIDAHLKGFDVDENLGLNLKPKLGVINNGSPYLGIGLTLPIGK
ncbi:MAG: hypothetical protein Roseis2KO_01650 [Roseivirga sp.]